MRSNLLTLQSTQSGIDKVQGFLATGRKVNSALDNPSSFFAAQSLNNRASDLSRLLDSMGQNISTIKQADKGVSSLTKLVEQADAIANQAATAASGSGQQATLTGSVKLSGSQDVTELAGVVSNTFELTFELNDENGAKIANLNTNQTSVTVTVASGSTVDQMIADINAISYGPAGSEKQAIKASLNDDGKLEIKSLTGGDLRVTLDNGADNNTTNDLNLAKALGFGDQALSRTTGSGTATEVALTAASKPALMSTSFRTSSGTDIASASTKLKDLVDADNAAIFQASGNAANNSTASTTGNKLMIGVNGKTAKAVADFTVSVVDTAGTDVATLTDSSTIQDLVDAINSDADLKDSIRASYDTTTGQFSIQAISTEVETIQVGLRATEASVSGDVTGLSTNKLGFGVNAITSSVTSDAGGAGGAVDGYSNFSVASAAGEIARLEKDYNSIRTQIDELVQDSGYAGVNLLKGDSLKTTFNEDRTSSLTTKGVTFTSEGLGLSKANFSSTQAIDTALTELRTAKSEVRNFGTTLANDLSIIQTRQNFTQETINNLQEGSDKLTLADKNEEGAKLLALQTQQQLGVISLSMASQSAQSVLRLF
jgi:flagellin-like hook-associated protein FlgL